MITSIVTALLPALSDKEKPLKCLTGKCSFDLSRAGVMSASFNAAKTLAELEKLPLYDGQITHVQHFPARNGIDNRIIAACLANISSLPPPR